MRGFIQIPLLLVVIAGSLIAGAVGYKGVERYGFPLINDLSTIPDHTQTANIENATKELDSDTSSKSQDTTTSEVTVEKKSPKLFPCQATGGLLNGFQMYVKNPADCPQQETDEYTVRPSEAFLCNGKKWIACPEGKRLLCPAEGDAYCVSNTQQVYVQPKVNPPNPVAKPVEVKTLYNPPPRIYKNTPSNHSPTPSVSSQPTNSYQDFNSAIEKQKQENLNRNTCQQLGGSYIVGTCVY